MRFCFLFLIKAIRFLETPGWFLCGFVFFFNLFFFFFFFLMIDFLLVTVCCSIEKPFYKRDFVFVTEKQRKRCLGEDRTGVLIQNNRKIISFRMKVQGII